MKLTYRQSCDLNPKFATIGERLQFMRADNAKLRPKLRPKLVKFTPPLEVGLHTVVATYQRLAVQTRSRI